MEYLVRKLPGLPIGARGSWSGYFINLDRATDRRQHMEAQLIALGIAGRYKRHSATDGRALKEQRTSSLRPGEIGIYRSHMDILDGAQGGGRAVHIIEDDVILCDLTAPVIDAAAKWRVLDRYDIVFSEIFVDRAVNSIRALHALYSEITANGLVAVERPDQIRVVDLKDMYLYGATSYVVGPRSIGRVLEVLSQEWRRGPNIPLDVAFQHAARVGKLRLGCFFPFVSTIDFELSQASSAGRDEKADDALVQRILRYSFFVRREIKGRALPALDRVLGRLGTADPDGAIELYTNVLKYYLSRSEERNN